MHQPNQERNSCSSCSITSCKVPTGHSSTEEVMKGSSFIAASAGVFLTPVFAAIMGASIYSESGLQQFLVGSVGMIGGMILTIGAARVLTRKERGHSGNE